MKLYYDPISTTSRPVALFCAEHGLDIDKQVVSLFANEHLAEAFAAINPNRQVPVLEDGDFRLTEASAILKYLADKVGSPAYPAEPRARARVNEWMDWLNTGFYRDFGYGIVYPQVLPDYAAADPVRQAASLATNLGRARKRLAILEARLAEGPYLCGEAITIADYLGSGFITVGDWVGFDLTPYPHILAWVQRLRALPHWTEVNGAFHAMGDLTQQKAA